MSFTDAHLFFDDVAVGQQWTSLGRTVTEADIVNFAGLSGDLNPIHMDHEFARSTPFRRPIAHGLLVLAIGAGSLFFSHVNDAGFWMVKEYCNLSVRDVLLRFNGCRVFMSLIGLGILLAYELSQ